jgi:hypothetical protein
VIRVQLITEDRTGGGLDEVIRSCVHARRDHEGRERLWFPRQPGNVDGAAQLLKECEKYELYRFSYSPRFDHVFYVLDARNVWRLTQLGVTAPEPPLDKSLAPFLESVKKGMRAMARGRRTDDAWAGISSGFHPQVLVWERESLILPVADRLGLGDAVRDVYGERQAYERVKQLHSRPHQLTYNKAIHGPRLLKRIAHDASLRAEVLASNPSLQALVDELVAL